MIIQIEDWVFQVDISATYQKTTRNTLDHCTCGYCRNYYEAAPMTYPELPEFLGRFGIVFHGPSEVMPFLPTLVLTCYRAQGKILRYGTMPIYSGDVLITPAPADDESFFLWAGEMALPWIQEEPEEDVVSPANLPEFMDRMEQIWLLRHGPESVQS